MVSIKPGSPLIFRYMLAQVLLPATLALAQQQESIAVLDLEGRGIAAIEAASLTDRLRSYLVQTDAITVVERGAMDQILREQDFQLLGCTSDECAVEVGQLLGVTRMVAGSIGKLGSMYTMDLRVVDVGTGKIVQSIIRDYRGEIEGLLAEMSQIANDLVDHGSQLAPAGTPPKAQIVAAEDPTPVQQENAPAQPTVTPGNKGIGGMTWLAILGLAGAGGYYGYNQGWFGSTPGGGDGDPYSVGNPPIPPVP